MEQRLLGSAALGNRHNSQDRKAASAGGQYTSAWGSPSRQLVLSRRSEYITKELLQHINIPGIPKKIECGKYQ